MAAVPSSQGWREGLDESDEQSAGHLAGSNVPLTSAFAVEGTRGREQEATGFPKSRGVLEVNGRRAPVLQIFGSCDWVLRGL